jgi:TonB family protein
MSPRLNNRPVFAESILPEGPSRVRAFGAGFGIECVALAAVLIIPVFMPHRLVVAAREWTTPITAPLISQWKPQPPPKPVVKKVVLKEIPKPVETSVVELPKPKIYAVSIPTPIVKQAVVKKEVAPTVDTSKNMPDQLLGSSAIPTLKKPRELVQTGGFGDPEGAQDNHNTTRAPNMNTAGGFDMPVGAGQGNGTGGAKGAKGVIASTGFGDQTAKGEAGGHGSLEASGFGTATVGGAQVKQTSAAVDRYKPMEILSIPKPQYTDEARAKKVEGDVVIQVVFSASGEVKVLHVVQGLGYGLDESAESAARQIRFRPAEQDGQPVDVTANVRMKCELAY